MIHSLSLSYFRNFSQKEISFVEGKNIIVGKNGHGKSNILEALSLPVAPLVETHPNYLLRQGEDIFFISYLLDTGTLSISYEKSSVKRKYMNNGKNTSKTKMKDAYPHVVSFHPLLMNLLYLGPSARRDFLDTILAQCFPEYIKTLTHYKKILTHRNKVLRNISEGKSNINELDFWNTSFIQSASQVYQYRKKIVDFFSSQISSLNPYFFGKTQNISFRYLSKIDLSQSEQELSQYIQDSKQKEILLRKTLRGPHLDDFEIHIDAIPLTHFASRGEVKTTLLGLKFLETSFLESFSQKKEILFLIDDLLSELDQEHRDILWNHIGKRQCIITCIEDFQGEGNRIFI